MRAIPYAWLCHVVTELAHALSLQALTDAKGRRRRLRSGMADVFAMMLEGMTHVDIEGICK